MSRVKTPNYRLIESHTYFLGALDSRTLEAGTFVRPLELRYVPKHVLENTQWFGFNKQTEVFCYCRWGILPIPKKIIREE